MNVIILIVVIYFSYVLRRILRRGVRYATEILQMQQGSFSSLVPVVVDVLVCNDWLFVYWILTFGCCFLTINNCMRLCRFPHVVCLG